MDQHEPTWANMGPTWSQLGVHLGPTWANLGQLRPTWGQLRLVQAKMSQRGPTRGQLEANMDLKIIEKPLFFLGFSNTSRQSMEALANALGDPFGTPWAPLGDARGALGDAWGSLGDALGGLGDVLGDLGDAWPGPVVANKANARGAKREASNPEGSILRER